MREMIDANLPVRKKPVYPCHVIFQALHLRKPSAILFGISEDATGLCSKPRKGVIIAHHSRSWIKRHKVPAINPFMDHEYNLNGGLAAEGASYFPLGNVHEPSVYIHTSRMYS